MAGKWWESAPVVNDEQQKPAQRGGGVFIPDQGAIDDAERADTALGYQGEGNARDAARLSNDVENRRAQLLIQQADKYNKDPTIAGYRESLGNFATGLRTSPTPQGDNALITAYVKVFDPGSVVNEGEREGVSSGQGYLASQIEAAKRNFGMNDAGLFTDEARKRIRAEMANIMGKRVKSYNERRAYFEKQSRDIGLDPSLVIGGHDAAPFVEQFREYDRANGLGEYAKRDERGPIPGATADNITFDIDTGAGAFGSQLQADRLTPAQQGALDAFLKANAGNPNFGPDQLGSFYRSIGVEGSVPASPAFFEAVRTGKPFDTTPDPTAADAARRAEMERLAKERYGDDPTTRASLLLKGGLLNWSDEAAGVLGAIYDGATGGSPLEGYQRERDLERFVQEESRDKYGVGYEVAGGLATPLGWMKAPKTVGEFGVQGAKIGALAGAGEGEGATGTVGGAVGGGTLGGLTGVGVGKIAPYAAPVVAKVTEKVRGALPQSAAAREFSQAADRLGLEYLPADRPGATASQMSSSLARVTLGGIPLSRKADQIVAKAAEKKSEIAQALGPASDVAGAGMSVKRGLASWERSTADRATKLYDQIPIAPTRPAEVGNTRAALGEINAGMESNPALSELVSDPVMKSYQAALEKGGLSWGDLKRFRTRIGEKRGAAKFTDGSSKADLDRLYSALSEDMRATAAAESPGALKAFTRANDYYRGRQDRIDSVSKVIFGNDYTKSDTSAFRQLMSWSQKDTGDFKKLYAAVRSLPEEDANVVRATIINRLGMAKAGGQDVTEDVFSPATFMTNWASLDKRAKNILFKGEHRKALDDFATVMSGMKQSERFANRSQTGLSVSGASTAAALLDNFFTGGAAVVGQLAFGRLMGSPTFAKWLSALAKKPNEAAALAHIEKLASLAAKSEPAVANDILSLQQRLAEAFSTPVPGRLAAEENDPERKGPPKNGERDDAQ